MSTVVATPPPAGQPLTKKVLVADAPTWCPGCGDFAVLASFYRVLEKLQYPHEKIVTFAGIGCSSRFPYFVNTHGGHFIHGRALPFAAGISLGLSLRQMRYRMARLNVNVGGDSGGLDRE